MIDIVAKVILLGLASAISPVIFGAGVSLLAGRRSPKARAFSFLAGSGMVVLILGIVGSTIGTGTISVGKPSSYETGIVDLLVGFLLMLFGIKCALPKRKEKTPGISDSTETTGPRIVRWFILGFALNITNLDAVMLNLTATKEVFQSGIFPIYKLLLTFVCDLFFLAPALLPVVIYLIMPNRASGTLHRIGLAEEKYGNYILMIIFLAFGMYLLSKGIERLA